MLPFIVAYLLILIVWGGLSLFAVKQVYEYAYRTDAFSRIITIIYLLISLFIAIDGLRILLLSNLDPTLV